MAVPGERGIAVQLPVPEVPSRPYATKSWPIDTSSRAFRYLRIRSTGGNASGYNDLMLGGFEAYGVLKGGRTNRRL